MRNRARQSAGQEDRTMQTARAALALLVPLSLGACAVAPPTGPSVLALPGKGKDLQTFQAEDSNCRNYAQAQTRLGTPRPMRRPSRRWAARRSAPRSAPVPARCWARPAGRPARGRRSAPGTGLLAGSVVGAGNAQASGASLQQPTTWPMRSASPAPGTPCRRRRPRPSSAIPPRSTAIRPRPMPTPTLTPIPTRTTRRGCPSAIYGGWGRRRW